MRIPCPIVFVLVLVICNTAMSQPVRRAQLAFSGTTFASQLLIQDVIRNVVDIGAAELDCPMPDSVVAEVLPESFQPVEAEPEPEEAGPPIYERWTIAFCGSEIPVLLTFWTMPRGGTAFSVQFQFQETVSAVDGSAALLQ